MRTNLLQNTTKIHSRFILKLEIFCLKQQKQKLTKTLSESFISLHKCIYID